MESNAESAAAEEHSDRCITPAIRRIALAAGGTGGHVYPALSVAAAYQRAAPGSRLLFIGTSGGCESWLVTAHGHHLEVVPGAPLFGVNLVGKALAMRRLVDGLLRARQLLRRERIQLVIGFGGYASAGTLLAARSLGLHTAILELNAIPGLTNRLLGRIVHRVYLGSAAARPAFAPAKTVETGTPVRSEIVRVGADKLPGPDAHGRFHILVTGGSLGSPFLNRCAAELIRSVAARGVMLDVQHQAGLCDPEAVSRSYEQAGMSASVMPYLERMPEAYAWAHFAIACAGAGTLAELAVSGLPALVVPLRGASEDHQVANARTFAAASGVLWLREADWRPPGLAAQITELLTQADI